ncbi:Uncharacterized protein OBRU01_17675 [Operophtera brumata]|uniref:Uncharacterized protein n=1 Tax=Operophtera brumata TaxID=104452 RepID=A0A0L7KVJ3_OPEBR|nr:Uncharacterized protein OBRU01_17675 [Operophtera brumata]
MNKIILLFGVFLCLVAVNARHHGHRNEEDLADEQDETLRPKEHISRHIRRRRNRYDYYPSPSYFPERRDDRDNQETLQQIYRLLEDIATQLRRTPPPPPPPQPIYIPYPMAFPMQVTCNTPQNTTQYPTPNGRFPAMEDINQNWGQSRPAEQYDDESDGARPISFEPVRPKQIMRRPAPEVDHGSQQVSVSEAPVHDPLGSSLSSSSAPVPEMCNSAILSCCGYTSDKIQQRQCFENFGCANTYNDGNACNLDSIERVLDSFRNAYSPVQRK